MSLYQAVTGKKIPFGRTPKVKERTCAPKRYILLELTLLPYCLFACIIDLLSARFDHALYSALNAIAFFYIFTWFIGWKESKEDVFRPRAARHRGAESTMSARSSGAKILGSKAIHLVAGLAALYERKGENATPFPLACLTSIHFSFPFRRSVLFPTAPLLAQQRPTPSARKLGVLTSVLLTLLVKLGVLIVGVLVLLVLGGVGTNVAVSFGGGQSLPVKSPLPAMSSPIAEATALLAGMAPSSPHLAEAPTECRASTRSCTSKAGRLASCTLNSRHRLSGSMAACNYPQRF